ncbi:unnamed protein product [Zymoseptoria tritici ST99CH_1E4]|uniref:Uncharacterized protein n=1 Tax=Zymoseptoria tritici ST99CH_1E4 TaxID=1276532 RepID=A0A2H1HBY0_ZYMTR|nr:unnamed protein product [Zymoseptoria tritici ST99CH_1E4]
MSPPNLSPSSPASSSSSAWETISDNSSDASSADTRSSSIASSCALHELTFLKRDNELELSAHTQRERPDRDRKRRWWKSPIGTLLGVTAGVALAIAIIGLALVAGRVSLCPPPRQTTTIPFDLERALVRPSDSLAMGKIAFHLPSRWMEWLAQPPLGTSNWLKSVDSGDEAEPGTPQHQLVVLQSFGRGLEHRVAHREEKRASWATEFEEIKSWVRRLESCGWKLQREETRMREETDSPWVEEEMDSTWIQQQYVKVAAALSCKKLVRQAANDATRTQLEHLLDDIHSHLSRELKSVDLYLETVANLAVHSNAQLIAINQEIDNIAVKAAARLRRRSLLPTTDESLIALLSDAEKTQIALAREEYGVLTFLALVSSTLPPAMRERQAEILNLATRMEELKQQLSSAKDEGLQQLTAVATSLPTTADLDTLLKEHHLNPRTMRTSSSEWMRTYSPKSYSSSPRSCLHPSTNHLRLRALVWLHPTLGAASWHWNGSGRSASTSREATTAIETALLFAGLGMEDPVDWHRVLGKAAGERWEDFRYNMVARKDGEDLRETWVEDYGRYGAG